MAKMKAPDGWRIVIWKDSTGKRWVDTIPEGALNNSLSNINSKGGRVIRVIDSNGKVIKF